MIIQINTKGDWEADLFSKKGALSATGYGDDTVEEIEKTIIEINRFLVERIEDIYEDNE